ncbi:MAG: hypothetical protein Q4B56_08225, partial [Erysipelotrichaceae bacterium]|nr:hypothetical protein [Erysipelotrichaceae bacterium]
ARMEHKGFITFYKFSVTEEMKSEFEWNRMMAQQLYSPYKVGDDSWERVHAAQKKFNESEFWHDSSALEELKKCFGKATENMVLTPPVYFDHGDRVFFGEHFYANTDLTILDENNVIFGDNVFKACYDRLGCLDWWKCSNQSRSYYWK